MATVVVKSDLPGWKPSSVTFLPVTYQLTSESLLQYLLKEDSHAEAAAWLREGNKTLP